MATIQQLVSTSGKMNRFKFVAAHWEQPLSFFEAQGIKQRNLHRLRQELKKKYPEILVRYNPLVANVILA